VPHSVFLRRTDCDPATIEARCGQAAFRALRVVDLPRLLQIDTYGSPARKLKGKKRQSIRFSAEAIQQLKAILAKDFS